MPMLYGNIVDLPFLLVISIQPPDSVTTYDYIQHICSFLDCFALEVIVEGNGTPLQCSCLENLRDRGAWLAAIYGVAQSRTRLK